MAERSAKSKSELPLGSETILLIDDEELVLNVTRKLLERFGYRILVAHHGREAIRIAQTYPGEIHLAILDLGMPIMGGAEAFRPLRQVRPQLKVIICSGYELDGAAQALIDAGASAFIQKPYRTEVIGPLIRRVLDGVGSSEYSAGLQHEVPLKTV
jgi:CheY-like chemotaxis protein